MAQPPPGISTTHRISFDGDRVVKTYRGWERGEPEREWRGLTLLHEYAPGLGPRPIAADLAARPPSITMSRVPGEPLGTGPVGSAQLDALAAAVDRLHHSIPENALATAGPQDTPSSFDALLRRGLAACTEAAAHAEPLVRKAFDAVRELLESGWVARCAAVGEPMPGFGLNDGNLANYLWDGESVRVVDFESAGRNDRAFDLADLVEHISSRRSPGLGIRAGDLLDRLDLTAGQRARIDAYRPAFAAFWLLRLLPPDGTAARRNPPGTREDQAAHLLKIGAGR